MSMKTVTIGFEYSFDNYNIGTAAHKNLISCKSFYYEVNLPATKKNLSLTLVKIKEKYKKDAAKACCDQLFRLKNLQNTK